MAPISLEPTSYLHRSCIELDPAKAYGESLGAKLGKEKSHARVGILQQIEAPAEQALILLCEKCGRKATGKEDNFANALQKELKHAAIERFGKHQVRTVVTSCFDICPKNRVVACVVLVNQKGHESAQFLELSAESRKKAETALLDFVEKIKGGESDPL